MLPDLLEPGELGSLTLVPPDEAPEASLDARRPWTGPRCGAIAPALERDLRLHRCARPLAATTASSERHRSLRHPGPHCAPLADLDHLPALLDLPPGRLRLGTGDRLWRGSQLL